MSEIALLIAFLTAQPSFQTDCVQTQDNGHSGYAVDTIAFAAGGKLEANQLLVSISRRIYNDDQCSGALTYEKDEAGRVTFAKSSSGFFNPNNGEQVFDADWALNPAKADQKEQGSIGINPAKGEVRIARNLPGSMRNSMLQLIPFKSAK